MDSQIKCQVPLSVICMYFVSEMYIVFIEVLYLNIEHLFWEKLIITLIIALNIGMQMQKKNRNLT
jgi:hypothetical protein